MCQSVKWSVEPSCAPFTTLIASGFSGVCGLLGMLVCVAWTLALEVPFVTSAPSSLDLLPLLLRCCGEEDKGSVRDLIEKSWVESHIVVGLPVGRYVLGFECRSSACDSIVNEGSSRRIHVLFLGGDRGICIVEGEGVPVIVGISYLRHDVMCRTASS